MVLGLLQNYFDVTVCVSVCLLVCLMCECGWMESWFEYFFSCMCKRTSAEKQAGRQGATQKLLFVRGKSSDKQWLSMIVCLSIHMGSLTKGKKEACFSFAPISFASTQQYPNAKLFFFSPDLCTQKQTCVDTFLSFVYARICVRFTSLELFSSYASEQNDLMHTYIYKYEYMWKKASIFLFGAMPCYKNYVLLVHIILRTRKCIYYT